MFARMLFGTNERRVLMLGLDAAGKTTILYGMKLNEIVTSIPTIGFNVETVKFNGVNLVVWDVGGQDRIRVLWKHYFENTDGLLFIVDASDQARFAEAREELHAIVNDDNIRESLKCVIIMANKMDLPMACDVQDLHRHLDLHRVRVPYYIQPCSALNRFGLDEGFQKLCELLLA